MDIKVGQIVYSRAGRDKGKKFIVTEIIDEAFVLISDGTLRRVEKPKKKKIKHLETTDILFEDINEKIKNKQKITNSEIKKKLETIEIENKD